jgi:broad specificity phosphatase PhoE
MFTQPFSGTNQQPAFTTEITELDLLIAGLRSGRRNLLLEMLRLIFNGLSAKYREVTAHHSSRTESRRLRSRATEREMNHGGGRIMSSRILRINLLVAAQLASAFSPSLYCQENQPPTVVIVVRHAEKSAGQEDDPSLSAAGVERSKVLIDAVAGANVNAVYSTQYKRTYQTAQPLAAKLGINVTEFPIDGSNVATYGSSIATEIMWKHKGQTVVVVGHSNTVPQIVQALGGKAVQSLTDAQYDRMFIVIVPASGSARVIEARYGTMTE